MEIYGDKPFVFEGGFANMLQHEFDKLPYEYLDMDAIITIFAVAKFYREATQEFIRKMYMREMFCEEENVWKLRIQIYREELEDFVSRILDKDPHIRDKEDRDV